MLFVVAACSGPANRGTGVERPVIPTAAPPRSATTSAPSAISLPRGDWYVAWVTGWLPDEFVDGLGRIGGVEVASVVWVGNTHVVETRDRNGGVVDRAPAGFVFPVELHAIDPAAHGEFVPAEVSEELAGLRSNEVALGASSAVFRRLGPGSTLLLEDGTSLHVAAVIADEWVGAAEMVTTRPDPLRLGADRPRYAVLRYTGLRPDLESALARLTDRPLRVWAESEIPIFRHADAVRPQIAIKERFGEFAFSPDADGHIHIDQAWVDTRIVTVELPLLGETICHRDFSALLRRVMQDLEAAGREEVIDQEAFLGCWNPRLISGRRDISRHAWGVAADINFGNPLSGPRSPTAPELLTAMHAVGITSGHDWVNPDPGHFEWYGP